MGKGKGEGEQGEMEKGNVGSRGIVKYTYMYNA